MNIFHKIIYEITLTASIALNAQTENSIKIKDATVVVNQNDLVFSVNGLVCSFCAFGLQKGLSKLDWIDKSRHEKGVFADINNQYVKVAMISGKEKKVQDAIDIIKSSGYEVFDYYLNPDGKLTQQFKVGENTHEK
jgi:hypothetical protein